MKFFVVRRHEVHFFSSSSFPGITTLGGP